VNHIEELQDVIRQLHGSDSTHVETVPVKESWQGQTMWEGEVEVFDIHDHPKAPRVYAWTHDTKDADKPRRSVTVLHIPPAISPQKAVQVAIAGEIRERLANEQADN
jgi:hypothetical protein